MSYQKENTPLTAGNQAATFPAPMNSSAPAYSAPHDGFHHQQQQQQQPVPFGFNPRDPDPTALSDDFIEKQMRYLGPISKGSTTAYRLDTNTLQIDFEDSFPEVTRPSDAVRSIRQLNASIYDTTVDFVHLVLSATFGLVWSLFLGLMFGMARFLYTYLAGPFNKAAFIMIASIAPSWRAFFRAGMDPIFESAALLLSNVQVRIGMEGKARYKAIQD